MMYFGLLVIFLGIVMLLVFVATTETMRLKFVDKSWKIPSILSAILFTIAGTLIGVGSSPSKDEPDGNGEMVFKGWLIFLPCLVWIGILLYRNIESKKRKRIEDVQKSNAERIDHENEMAKNIYLKYEERQAYVSNEYEEANMIEIIADM